MWSYYGHFQLHIQLWSLDWLTGFVSFSHHVGWYFKSHSWSRDAKVVRIQSGDSLTPSVSMNEGRFTLILATSLYVNPIQVY